MRIGPKALVGLGLPAALRPHAPDKGVPDTITISGVVYQLMIDANGQRLQDATGQYLYGKKVS